jgi:DNA-binding MarR family transcriptional regulator
MARETPSDIRFLNLLEAIRGLSPFDAMTADEETLLQTLIVRWHAKQDIPISAVMNGMAGASGTTAYRRIVGLRNKGLVQLRVDTADRRVKYVEPTALAKTYRQRIRSALEEAAKTEALPR